MFMMRVGNMQINLDACPAFKVWQDCKDVHISAGHGIEAIVKDADVEEVHRAIAYKINHDARHFELEKTIHFIRRVSGD